jgi:hypothetical protein
MNKKRYATILMATMLMVSCQNKKATSLKQPLDKGTAKLPDSMVIIKNKKTKTYQMDFPEFWVKFRAAVLKQDTNQIIEMTEFPLQTRGELDSDPDVEYSKKEFFAVFNIYIKQWSGQLVGNEGSSELAEIKKVDSVKKADAHNGYARIGDMVFNKTSEGWKLVFVYLSDDAIDEINKTLSPKGKDSFIPR